MCAGIGNMFSGKLPGTPTLQSNDKSKTIYHFSRINLCIHISFMLNAYNHSKHEPNQSVYFSSDLKHQRAKNLMFPENVDSVLFMVRIVYNARTINNDECVV